MVKTMPYRTVDQAFNILCDRLIPTGTETGKAKSHYQSIKTRLEEHYDLRALFYSGSANNATSISGHSDVDLFARIPPENLNNNSSTALRGIKECLQARFPRTNVFVDSPAVVLDFGSADWDIVDVIPAYYIEQNDGNNVFGVPSPDGAWMRSSPTTHKGYITKHNNRLGLKLKPLIRLVKAWKYYNSVPISSFYIELRTTRYMESENEILYSVDIRTVFRSLFDSGLASMQDPMGISGYVRACNTDAQKADALSKLKSALTRAEKANAAELNDDDADAFDWWDLVFGGYFPNRYYARTFL